jgi:hypothetical protein
MCDKFVILVGESHELLIDDVSDQPCVFNSFMTADIVANNRFKTYCILKVVEEEGIVI